jgi:hypothetical protein
VVYTRQTRGGVNRLVGLMQASRQVKIPRENPSLSPNPLVSIDTDITHVNGQLRLRVCRIAFAEGLFPSLSTAIRRSPLRILIKTEVPEGRISHGQLRPA